MLPQRQGRLLPHLTLSVACGLCQGGRQSRAGGVSRAHRPNCTRGLYRSPRSRHSAGPSMKPLASSQQPLQLIARILNDRCRCRTPRCCWDQKTSPRWWRKRLPEPERVISRGIRAVPYGWLGSMDYFDRVLVDVKRGGGVALLPANDLRGLAGETNIPPCVGQRPIRPMFAAASED